MVRLMIDEKIAFILKTLVVIRDILTKREKTPLFAEYLLFAAEKKAEEVIESAIGVNQEILKQYFRHLSSSYYESFSDLRKLEIFTEEELISLASTAGFRNRLAHDYLELSTEITIKTIHKILKIYPVYLKKIKDFTSKISN